MASAGAFGALIIHDRAGARGEALPINNQKLIIGRQVPIRLKCICYACCSHGFLLTHPCLSTASPCCRDPSCDVIIHHHREISRKHVELSVDTDAQVKRTAVLPHLFRAAGALCTATLLQTGSSAAPHVVLVRTGVGRQHGT